MTTALFIGPMLLAHRMKLPVTGILRASLGSIPASALRLCGAFYLVFWLLSWVWVSGYLWSGVPFRPLETPERPLLDVAIVVFLAATSLQSLRVEAKLASFTNQVAIAVFIAALLRAEDGWYAVPAGLELPADVSQVKEVWNGFSDLAFYCLPLAVFAADFGFRLRDRRQLAMTSVMGVVVPLFGSLLAIAVIDAAVSRSELYQPSLRPDVAMALWSHMAASAVIGRKMICSITLFGAMRFGFRFLAHSLGVERPFTRRGWILLAGAVTGIVASHIGDSFSVRPALDVSGRLLTAAAAVLTGDLLVRSKPPEAIRRVDVAGSLALLVGLAAPSVPLTYLVALVAGVSFRSLERLARRAR